MEMVNNLKALRTKAGMTQKALSEKAGIPQNRISEYENASSLANVTTGYLFKLSTALGTTIDSIISPISDLDIRNSRKR